MFKHQVNHSTIFELSATWYEKWMKDMITKYLVL